eukprot:5121721-Amphidinium_carterae.1
MVRLSLNPFFQLAQGSLTLWGRGQEVRNVRASLVKTKSFFNRIRSKDMPCQINLPNRQIGSHWQEHLPNRFTSTKDIVSHQWDSGCAHVFDARKKHPSL